ncbi:MAG: YigZ family protein [Candidatus Gracilibacteria bacterium]|nr:YigZ family protein [Candidatus Gracilibacteria bacterium]
MTNKLSLDLGEGKEPSFKRKILQNIIVDRKSKYTVVGGYVDSKEEIKSFIGELLRDKYFQKSIHNTYAYRIRLENGSILEGKNDDGEKGAGNCILRELQRSEVNNMIIVVTRYFGGIHLQADRFKNVIDASKEILKHI